MEENKDNLSQGYVSIYRSIFSHWLAPKGRAYTELEAWIYLICKVNFQDRRIRLGAELIDVAKGSTVTSVRELSIIFGWSNTKVKRFLDMLFHDGMLTYESDTRKTSITIVNYGNYQGIVLQQTTEKRHESGTETNQKRNGNETETKRKRTNNNSNNSNNYNNSNKIIMPWSSDQFLNIWNIWKEYKMKQFKFKYKTELSEQAALKQLSEISEGNEIVAIKLIENAIAKSWQGIHPDKNIINGQSKQTFGIKPATGYNPTQLSDLHEQSLKSSEG